MENPTLQDNRDITYMNVKTASTYLGVAKSTIYKWVESGFIPHRKLRKHVLFIKKDIDHWVYNDCKIVEDLPSLPKSIKSKYDGEIQIRA